MEKKKRKRQDFDGWAWKNSEGKYPRGARTTKHTAQYYRPPRWAEMKLVRVKFVEVP